MESRLSAFVTRVLFAAAFLLAGLAVAEEVSNLFGLTLSILGGFSAARLLELATIAVIFVIALQLREIKRLSGGRT